MALSKRSEFALKPHRETKPLASSMLLRVGALAALGLTLAGCQTTSSTAPAPVVAPTSPAEVGEFRPGSGYLKGYLGPKQLPDSLALLPKPPAKDSAAAVADLATHRATRSYKDSARRKMEAQDNELKFPAAANTFSCALDLPISQEATPHVNMLLRRTLIDAGLATYGAKDAYKRQRPFAALGEGTCAPHEETKLAKDGSYPSGHAALGWAWALVLTQVAPDRANALLVRGRAFGQSRVICGVHWQSDVDMGREVGSASFARLQSDPVYMAQVAAARTEVAAARAKGLNGGPSCAAEAATLAQ